MNYVVDLWCYEAMPLSLSLSRPLLTSGTGVSGNVHGFGSFGGGEVEFL